MCGPRATPLAAWEEDIRLTDIMPQTLSDEAVA